MIGSFRKSFETEEGQAIVIGGLMMLILAFGLMVTLNIGVAVQEKIRLQNNSDAAAYSLAVTEAQAFNYISFTNRVQAAHYNMMMTVQTYQTNMLIFESVLGTIYDLFAFINTLAKYIPGIGEGVMVIVAALGVALTIIRVLYYGRVNGPPTDLGFIPIMGYVKYVIWYLNYYGHYGSDMIVGGAVWLKILSNMHDFKVANDERAAEGSNAIYEIINIALNGWEYLSTFDKYAGGIPPVPAYLFKKSIHYRSKVENSKEKDKNASDNKEGTSPYKRDKEALYRQKIMGDIANASRSDKFNLDRHFSWKLPVPLVKVEFEKIGASKLIGVSPRILQNRKKENKWGFYNAMSLVGGEGDISDGMIKEIRRDAEARSAGSWGDILATDKAMSLTLGIDLGSIPIIGKALGFEKTISFGTYVWSDNNGGNYWRWAAPDKNPTGICWDFSYNRNNNCMKTSRQTSNLISPPWFYLRVPFRIWDFIPDWLGSFIKWNRNTCFKWNKNVRVKDWNTEHFGPDDRGIFNSAPCRHKCFWGGCCCWNPLAYPAKFLELIFKKRIPNHESVNHLTNANQYYFGIAPYVKFLPNSDRKVDYNQPSTWMIMNLSPDKYMQGKHWNFSHSNDISGTSSGSGGRNALSTDPIMDDGNKFSEFKMFNILDPGINVMSRARVYYHRPGNWNEHPNFFNPYWRAQLAPIAPKIGALIGRALNIDPDTKSNVPSSGVIGKLSNFKSALGDMFANLLSRIITH